MAIRDFEPLPYYRWYWRDFRSSRAVQKLHYVARGLYRELLDECWARGFVKNDLDTLADVCDCPKEVMHEHWPTLIRFFVDIGDGKMINERLENERSDEDRKRVKRVIAGRKSGAARRKQKRTNANTDEQTGTSVRGSRTKSNTLLSSSSSSSISKQSKSSSSSASSSNDVIPLASASAAAGPTGRASADEQRGGEPTAFRDLLAAHAPGIIPASRRLPA